MLRLPKLRFVSPRTFAEAARALAAEPGAVALAGGTDLVPKLKRRQLSARTLVDLSGVRGFRGVERRRVAGRGRLVIGAGTPIAELLRSPATAGLHALREAAASVGTPQIRSAATMGGNLAVDTRCSFYDQGAAWREAQGFCLKTHGEAPCRVAPGSERCFALASGDLPPALIALEARVRLLGLEGERELALEDLYRDEGGSALRLSPGELIVAVELDAAAPRAGYARGTAREENGDAAAGRSTYRKLRRRGSFDFAALGVAVALRRKGEALESCRIVLGGVASSPVVAAEAGRLMEGGAATPERIAAAAAAAVRRARPVENADFPAAYRRRLAGVFVARALTDLTQPEAGGRT